MSKKKSSAPHSNYVHTVRDRACAANIFRGSTPDGHTYLYFELSRSWKTLASGREGYSKKFYARNRDALSNVVDLAARWIEEHPEAADGNWDRQKNSKQQAPVPRENTRQNAAPAQPSLAA